MPYKGNNYIINTKKRAKKDNQVLYDSDPDEVPIHWNLTGYVRNPLPRPTGRTVYSKDAGLDYSGPFKALHEREKRIKDKVRIYPRAYETIAKSPFNLNNWTDRLVEARQGIPLHLEGLFKPEECVFLVEKINAATKVNWVTQGFSFLIQEGEEKGEMFDTSRFCFMGEDKSYDKANWTKEKKEEGWNKFVQGKGLFSFCDSPVTRDKESKDILENLFTRLNRANLTFEGLTRQEVQGCHAIFMKSSHNLDRGSGFHRDVSFNMGASVEEILEAEDGFTLWINLEGKTTLYIHKMQGDKAFSCERIYRAFKERKARSKKMAKWKEDFTEDNEQIKKFEVNPGEGVLFSSIWTWHSGPCSKNIRMALALRFKKFEENSESL